MTALLLSILAIVAVTTLAAKLVTAFRPGMGQGAQIAVAAASTPVLAVLIFIAVVVLSLSGISSPSERNAGGMVVFASIFFLLYELVAGAVVGVPTAILAVRAFRG